MTVYGSLVNRLHMDAVNVLLIITFLYYIAIILTMINDVLAATKPYMY